MPCTNCGNTPSGCGCEQKALHISQICNPVSCPTQQCSESFPAQCSIYTGDDILCRNVILATSGENITQIVSNIIAYFCDQTLIEDAISCGEEEVIPENTSIQDAIPLIVAYFCNAVATIELTPGPQGIQGIQGIQGVQGPAGADGADAVLPYEEYVATLLFSDPMSPTVSYNPVNDLGAIVWAYVSDGVWTGTLAGAFVPGETFAHIVNHSGNANPNIMRTLAVTSTDVVTLRMYISGTPSNAPAVEGAFIEIKNYL